MDIAIAVPIILALTQAVKMAGVPKRFGAIASVITGILFYYTLGMGALDVRILDGIVAGLTASGLWSGVKSTSKKQ